MSITFEAAEIFLAAFLLGITAGWLSGSWLAFILVTIALILIFDYVDDIARDMVKLLKEINSRSLD